MRLRTSDALLHDIKHAASRGDNAEGLMVDDENLPLPWLLDAPNHIQDA